MLLTLRSNKVGLYIHLCFVAVVVIYVLNEMLPAHISDSQPVTQQWSWLDNINMDTLQDYNQYKDMLNCQRMRLARMQKTCKELGYSQPEPLLEYFTETKLQNIVHNLITDDKHKVLFQVVPKTGCTSWKIIAINNSIFNTTRDLNEWSPDRFKFINKTVGKLLQYYNKSIILEKLTTYFNILTVRHPLHRLESGFKNKWMPKMKRKLNETGNSFEQFLETVLKRRKVNKKDIFNSHWSNITGYAHPCIIPYSFISKTESSNLEMEYIIKYKLSGYGKPVTRNKSMKSKYFNNTENKLKFDETEHSNLKGERLILFSNLMQPVNIINRLMETHIFGADMKLFGYDYTIVDNEVIATCENYDSNGMCC